MTPTLDGIGRWLLPRLDAVLHEATDYLLAAQEYVQAWRRVLDV